MNRYGCFREGRRGNGRVVLAIGFYHRSHIRCVLFVCISLVEISFVLQRHRALCGKTTRAGLYHRVHQVVTEHTEKIHRVLCCKNNVCKDTPQRSHKEEYPLSAMYHQSQRF